MEANILKTASSWPLNPDSVLWFEFLLNPSVLRTHLEKAKPGKTQVDI